MCIINYKWDKVFKNGSSKICGRQPLKILLGPSVNTWTHMKNVHTRIAAV